MTFRQQVSLLLVLIIATASSGAQEWEHPLENWAKLESPLVEITPFVFKEKLYLMESWQKQWEYPEEKDGTRFTEDEIRIRDVAADRIVSTPLIGHDVRLGGHGLCVRRALGEREEMEYS